MAAYLGIIDGSGAWRDATYAREMRYSFCRQLFVQSDVERRYIRGPSFDGYFIETRAERMVSAILGSGADEIFLAGYSRGGSIAVIASRMLAEQGCDVKALFLFDPVERHLSASSRIVPRNVQAAYIARRAIGAVEMEKYDFVLLGDPGGHSPVRNWFGTTAVDFENRQTRRYEKTFLGSHGAMGGVGWRDVREDVGCQIAVAGFFNNALSNEGLKGCLAFYPPRLTF